MSAIRLSHVEIEGFRGYSKNANLEISGPLILLYGHNGTGKSSTLMAVEWCIFGDVAYLARLEGRSRDELVNQFSPSAMARVSVVLGDGHISYRISRAKKIGSTKTDFRVSTPEGDFTGDEAERVTFKLLGITLDDFIRAIYLHQESVKGLLVEEMASRDEALDRLFGLERIRNIVESVPLSKVRDIADDLEQKKATLSRKIEGAIEQCQLDLNKLKTKAAELGVSENEISLELALGRSEGIIHSLDALGSECGFAPVTILPSTELAQMDGFERKVKSTLREFETRIISAGRITELNTRKSELESVLRRYRQLNEELTANNSRLASLVAEFGKLEQIAISLDTLEKKMSQQEESRYQVDINSRLIEDAVTLLRTGKRESCPICGQTIDHDETLTKLEAEIRVGVRREIIALDNERRELEARKRELQSAKASMDKLAENTRNIELEIQSTLVEATALFGTTLSDEKHLLATTDARLEQIQKQISEFNAVYIRRATVLDTVRSDLDKIAAVSDILKKSMEFNEITSHFKSESEEIQQLQAAIVELRLMEGQLSTVMKTAGEVQAGLAKDIISQSQDDIESIYTRLCKHPVYDRLKVDVRARDVRGLVKNSYSIKAYNSSLGTETFVSTRFSAGQMNSVAIAICLALAKRLALKLGFLILDDPSQSLDSEHKRALVQILKDLSTQKQLIVSTHDEELRDLLRDQGLATTTFEFKNWGISGPIVEAR